MQCTRPQAPYSWVQPSSMSGPPMACQAEAANCLPNLHSPAGLRLSSPARRHRAHHMYAGAQKLVHIVLQLDADNHCEHCAFT